MVSELLVRFWHSPSFLDTDRWVELARVTEDAGFDGIAVSDHLVNAVHPTSAYPGSGDGRPFWPLDTPWPEPWALIAAMAAATRRLRFVTNVYVAPARDLITVARGVATAAVISSGRVVAGFGVGWSADEYALTGQEFTTRGRRLDEMIPLLRRLWAGDTVEHDGVWYHLPPLRITPVAGDVSVYCGGDSPAAVRRAVTACDGWIGSLYPADQTAAVVPAVLAAAAAADRDPATFAVMVAPRGATSPQLVARLASAGATDLIVSPWLGVARKAGGRPAFADVEASLYEFAATVIAVTGS